MSTAELDPFLDHTDPRLTTSEYSLDATARRVARRLEEAAAELDAFRVAVNALPRAIRLKQMPDAVAPPPGASTNAIDMKEAA